MDQCATEPMRLPESIRFPTVKFLNWVYNDLFNGDGPTAAPSGTGQVPGIAAFGALARVHYQWSNGPGRSTLTITLLEVPGVVGFEPCSVSGQAAVTGDRPPFALLMRVWVDLCHRLGLLSEGDWVDLDGPIEQAKALDQVAYGDW